MAFRHTLVAPNLYRFVFPSASRAGVEHELLLDLEAAPEDRVSCLCEAALAGKRCKHRRAVEAWMAANVPTSHADARGDGGSAEHA